MTEDININLSLSVSDINLVLEALGEMKAVKVYKLISYIKHEGDVQLLVAESKLLSETSAVDV